MRINILIFLFIFIFSSNVISEEIKIKFKIENYIITNQDIINEANYLVVFNKNLKNLTKKEIKSFAINSLIQEKIKYIELIKYFNFNDLSQEANNLIFKDILLRLNKKNKNELLLYLNERDFDLEEITEKFKIELLWNKLIYDKYIKNVSIDRNRLKEKIKKNLKNNTIYEYNLYEILFEVEEGESKNQKYLKIKNYIKNNSFDLAATVFSISNTADNGGKIGWVKETQLSKDILTKIKTLEISEFTEPMFVGNGYLFLKLNDKRKVITKINIDKELEMLVQKETDRQLNQYSTIYFNKIKKNILINET